ncbi:MAG: Gfo/Idh/MocA family oxidoreductase [Anaerolineaceae bacterium]|nr:Gfo/Idh/MocA family oxidoreductase [Anaerolineaceae bacterium]MDE0329105.1 Gfo/Idh/MocA family oxidoreductase [Anaerolineaceae bacterium]
MTLKVAVVGMGGIGNQHAGVYSARDDAEVVAVCDIIRERSDQAAERFGCQGFYSVQEMLAAGLEIDAASMTTAGVENGGDHYEPTMELLEAGLPVLGEKPISNEIDKAKEMVALAREKGLRYGVNLNHRFTPAAEMAKGWVGDGRLGDLNMINMSMWINNPKESSPWFHLRALHPHSIDVMRYFAGDVDKVQAFMKKGTGRAIWSNAQVNMLFTNGMIGSLRGSYDGDWGRGSYGLEALDVVGMKGRFTLTNACEELTFYPRMSIETEVYNYVGGMKHFGETFKSRIGRWVEQNIEGVAPEEIDGSGLEALKAQFVIEAAIESWQSGQVVSVERF